MNHYKLTYRYSEFKIKQETEMALSTCQHCDATISPSLADDGHWIDSERSAVCADNQRLHSPSH